MARAIFRFSYRGFSNQTYTRIFGFDTEFEAYLYHAIIKGEVQQLHDSKALALDALRRT